LFKRLLKCAQREPKGAQGLPKESKGAQSRGSPSFAHNLFWAYEGFSHQKKIEKAGGLLVQKVTEKNDGIRPTPGGEFFRSSKGVQKIAYSVIMEEVFPDSDSDQVDILCMSRCEKLFAPYDIHCNDGANFPDALSQLENTRGHVAIKVLKTWLNGWATSHRMHEDTLLQCVLGCKDAPDSLNHYVFCPHMCAFQKFIFDGISNDPLIRIGIKSPCEFSFKVISCLFSAYHALKSDIRAGKIRMQPEGWNQPSLRCAWSVFANVLKTEAGELHVFNRAFSLPKFIDFLCTGRLPLPRLAINAPLQDDSH